MEYGPTEDSIRKANADVRQCLSDMGTEFAIANFPDVVDEYIDNSAIGNKQNEFLYPFAMQVPGLQHIVDWVFRQGISRLTFFAQWQKKSKAVLQYAHSANHRGHMEDIVNERAASESTETASLVSSLAKAPGRFAKWRWKTLDNAVRDLLRVEASMKMVMAAVANGEASLGIRDTGAIDTIKEAVLDEGFWQQARAIQALVQPLMKFSSWCHGCDCHEPDLKTGKTIECPFKGCRARGVAKRVDSVRVELDMLRSSLQAGQFGEHTTTTSLNEALTEVMGNLWIKMRWVNELPYLIWQDRRVQLACVSLYKVL